MALTYCHSSLSGAVHYDQLVQQQRGGLPDIRGGNMENNLSEEPLTATKSAHLQVLKFNLKTQ